MKLLHLQLLPILSGVQNFSLHLLDGLADSDYEIHVAGSGTGALSDAVRERGWKYHAMKSLRREIWIGDLLALGELILLMRRERFDIVHTNSSKPGLLGRIAARLCGVPLIVHTNHGFPFHQGQPRAVRIVFMLLERFSQLWGDRTVFVNNSDRELAIRTGLIPRHKASTIYNAIPERQRRDLESIAQERELPSAREIVIGSTMRFSEQKNALQVIISAVKVCRRTTGIKFIILGDGEQFELCRRIIRENSMNDRIILPGWDNRVAPWLMRFDAFLLYSRWEAQPFSIIEAMHAGLPVIGSDIDALKELISDETGYIVPLKHPEDLEDLLVSLAEDFSQAFAKGKKGSEVIGRLCDHAAMTAAYDSIYRGQR